MEILNQANQLLVARLGPMGPLYAAGILGTLLILIALPVMLRKREDPLDRLKQSASGSEPRAQAAGAKQLLHAERSAQNEKINRLAGFLEPQDAKEFSAMRLKLMQAGYRQKSAVRLFYFAQLVLSGGLMTAGVVFAVIHGLTGTQLTPKFLAMSILLPTFAGYYLPKYWIERRRQTRLGEIVSGFPDALDLMLVCVEAGQSLDQSIIRVAGEIRAGFPALAEEFEIVANEMKAGKDKVQVLKDFGERAGVADVASFTTVLIQSATFGTSIAEALRVYAAEMRDKRVMRAEEKANVLPTKLTLGTMMFTLPPLMIILIGPSVYNIYTTLSGMQGL